MIYKRYKCRFFCNQLFFIYKDSPSQWGWLYSHISMQWNAAWADYQKELNSNTLNGVIYHTHGSTCMHSRHWYLHLYGIGFLMKLYWIFNFYILIHSRKLLENNKTSKFYLESNHHDQITFPITVMNISILGQIYRLLVPMIH